MRTSSKPKPASPPQAEQPASAAAGEFAVTPTLNHRQRVGAGAICASQVVLLLWAAWQNLPNLNADGVAYVRLGMYYAHGQTHLMVSGYWGPMLSWLVAVFLKLGAPVLLAGRLAMVVSALVFASGSLAVLRGLRLPAGASLVGYALAAGASVFWSVEYITPDLLASGLVGHALGQMLRLDWIADRRKAALAGLFWGLAYLAKAVALPLAFGLGVLVAVLWSLGGQGPRNMVWRRLLTTWLVCLVVAAPWITTLSCKYGRLTVSTSARIAHAVAGPPDVERYHPYARTLHRPEPGRVTSWEDPSGMAYRGWSAFASSANFRHQLALVGRNSGLIVSLLGAFDLAHAGVLAALACAVLALRRRSAATEWARWPPVMLVGLSSVYLPLFLLPVDERYFYAAYPLLFGATVLVLSWSARFLIRTAKLQAVLVYSLAVLFFAPPVVLGLSWAMRGATDLASVCAQELAQRLTQANVRGPIVGSGLLAGGRAGLYTAFLLDVPWYGDELNPTAESYRRSGARLVVTDRLRPITKSLDQDAGFRNLDARLFQSSAEAEQFPLTVYEVLTAVQTLGEGAPRPRKTGDF